MGLFDNVGGGLFGRQPAAAAGTAPGASPYQMPQTPWGQRDDITAMALGLLSGKNLNEGMQNAVQAYPAGLASNTAKRRDMYTIQEKNAERARQTAAMNAGLKLASGIPLSSLTPAERTAYEGSPEIALKFEELKRQPVGESWSPLTDPAARAAAGIPDTDLRPALVSSTGDIKFPGSAATSININEGKLTEGQSKDINFYARGRAADKEITPELEKALTDLPATMWSNAPVIGNYGQTPEFQTAKRAAAEFLAVVLRKDTGAAVTPQEFEAYGPMYLPVPGDTEQVLTAKRTARKRVIDSIKRGLGTAREQADQIDEEMAAEAPARPPGAVEPPIGTVEDGFRYKGGGGGNPDNWEPVS